jgi:tetraacyldisaccharide 4'-kinase
LTRCDQVTAEEVRSLRQEVGRWAPQALIAEAVHEPAAWQSSEGKEMPLDSLAGRNVAGFCGIGNPEAFRQTLTRLGLNVAAWRVFPDHHAYTRDDIEDLRRWARAQAEETALVTTQKDLVKIRLDRMGERSLWALRIQLRVTAEREALEQRLMQASTFV